MADDRFIFTTTLEGYINALKPAGKYNNCTISFRIPDELLDQLDKQHEKCLEWAAAKFNGKRHEKALPKWEEDGLVKYSYNGKDSAANFPWIDAKGNPIPLNTDIRRGTVVRLIAVVKPYIYGNKGGSSFKVLGAQVIKLVTGGGSDAGGLEADEVAALFGETEGFSVDDPSFQPAEESDEDREPDSDEEIPF